MSNGTEQPLRFAILARVVVERQFPNFSSAAQACGMTTDRLSKLLRGDHEPLSGDGFALGEGLRIAFKSSDFKERGLDL